MKIEMPYHEIGIFAREYLKKSVGIKYAGNHSVELNFMASVTVSMAEVWPHGLLLDYKTSAIVNMMIGGMRNTIRQELAKFPALEWLEDNKQLSLNLQKLPQLSEFLRIFSISSCSFEETGLKLELASSLPA